jgi:hypothetical protein
MASSRSRSFLAALALLASIDVHAAIIEQYSYVDPYGLVKTADTGTAYINPNGAVSFAAIAGIERKLEVSFLAEDGTVLDTATSPVITAEDRITLDGRPFYGFFLDLQAPAGDGHYTIRARVLTSDDHEVATETYPVMLDRTPPSLSGGFGWKAWRPADLRPMPDDVLVSRYDAKRLWAHDVIETGSGLDTTAARFQSLILAPGHLDALTVPHSSEDQAVNASHLARGDASQVRRYPTQATKGTACGNAQRSLSVRFDLARGGPTRSCGVQSVSHRDRRALECADRDHDSFNPT